MNISKLRNWKQQGEVATLFTVAALVLMAAGTFLGSQRLVQENVLKLGSFAYDNNYRAHFYKGPTFEEKDRIPGQPNSGYTLIRGSLCFTGTTIPSQLQQFWVHTPQDPNRGYPQKACDNTNADTKDDCIVHEGRTVKYIAPQTSRPYCDSPDVGKANWRAWDFTLKLQAPYSKDLCSGLFVSSTSSFVTRDPIEMDMAAWHRYLGQRGVDCGPTPTPAPSTQPTVTNEPTIIVPTAKPTINTIIVPSGYVTAILLPTDKPRCPDPKKPCPSVTPVGECRNDIACSKANPCPRGYACLHEKSDPLQIGVCVSTNPKCNPTSTPTPSTQPPVTGEPVQAKIKGDIIVNSCVKPDAVSTIICEKNNPARCIDTAATVKFIGQDPTNPNKWLYSYEHVQAPGANGGLESVIKNALYENMQAFAQYTSNGLIREAGRVGFPPSQIGNLRAYATIPSSQSEAIINYEVPKNDIVCPPVSPSVKPSEAPTAIPTPGICKYSAVVEVIDEATGLPVPVSQMGDASKWGLANDKQPNKPHTMFNVYGDVVGSERVSKYKYQTDTLTFYPNNIYSKGEKAFVNLYLDTNKWQITRKFACNGANCPIPNEPVTGRNLDQYGSKTDGFTFDCGTDVKNYGWYVKKLPPRNPENPGQGSNPGICVMRDGANATACTPKNVKATRKSTSTVSVTWNAPDASCGFTAGSNGDFYRIDLIDMTENPAAVITTCDKITKTGAECTLSPTYNPNSSATRGNFKRGHNYVASVYAFKEIPGATSMCVSNPGNAGFNRPARDEDNNEPDPETPPIGGGNGKDEVLTRQLDWMVDGKGICWAGWSNGSCNLAYNGTNGWVQSITDPRFQCLAPYGGNQAVPNQETSIIALMPNQPEVAGIQTKRVDCSGNVKNACIAAKNTNISQCESDLSNATTVNGASITLKQNECWKLDADLGIKPFPCPANKPTNRSEQPAPRVPGQPQPTAQPGSGNNTGTKETIKGVITVTKATDDDVALKVQVGLNCSGDNDIVEADVQELNLEKGEYEFTSNNFNSKSTFCATTTKITYTINDDPQEKEVSVDKTIDQKDFNRSGAWDVIVEIDPSTDEPAKDKDVAGTFQIVKKSRTNNIYFEESDLKLNYADTSLTGGQVGTPNVSLESSTWKVAYSIKDLHRVKVGDIIVLQISYTGNVRGGGQDLSHIFSHTIDEDDLDNLSKLDFVITLDPNRDYDNIPSLLSTVSLQNNSSSPIKSVSIASCDAASKCANNTVSVGLAAGANTKFKPTFSVPNTTRRLSCVVNFANGTSKQCTPQLVTGSAGLQFTIAAQANNTVSTNVLSPLKTADTNRDCKVTSTDATGLRDLDGNGSVNAADTSLFLSYIGQNACN